MKEIKDYVLYLNGLLKEYESLELIDCKDDLFQARKTWDENFYFSGEGSYREEQFVDKSGKTWYLLLEHSHD